MRLDKTVLLLVLGATAVSLVAAQVQWQVAPPLACCSPCCPQPLALPLHPLPSTPSKLQQDPVCHSYISKGLIQPGTGSLHDVIIVTDAFVVGDVTVSLDVSHPRVGALEVGRLTGSRFQPQIIYH